MGLIREPKNVDFLIKSEPWNIEELGRLRILMDSYKKKAIVKKVKKELAI